MHAVPTVIGRLGASREWQPSMCEKDTQCSRAKSGKAVPSARPATGARRPEQWPTTRDATSGSIVCWRARMRFAPERTSEACTPEEAANKLEVLSPPRSSGPGGLCVSAGLHPRGGPATVRPWASGGDGSRDGVCTPVGLCTPEEADTPGADGSPEGASTAAGSSSPEAASTPEEAGPAPVEV